MAAPDAAQVDDYIVSKLIGDDADISAARSSNAAAGLPAIDVSDAQGKLLALFVKALGVRRVLEVGTLGGVSTIYLARALPAGGTVITLEIDALHAEVARANLERAGVSSIAEVRVAPALDTLKAMIDGREAPFDLVFIDADKENNAAYAQAALQLSRPGTVIIVDNVVREGAVADAASTDSRVLGTRALYDYVASESRLDATAIQTLGAKHWNGFLFAVVQ